MGLQEQLRAKREETERWIKQWQAELRHGASELEAHGREVYADAVKTGKAVAARTTAEVRALGRSVVSAKAGSIPPAKSGATASGPAAMRTLPAPKKGLPGVSGENVGPAKHIATEVAHQGGAALSGAVDEASFGLADNVSALVQALAHGDPSHLGEQYRKEIAEEREKDAYDEQHYGLARGAGRVAGFAGSLVGGGAVEQGARLAAKTIGMSAKLARAAKGANAVKRVVPMAQAGLTKIALAGGATSGVAGQAANDLISRRVSGLGDYAGAALGGAAGALTMRIPGAAAAAGAATKLLRSAAKSPMVAGGVEGAAASAAQGMFNGQAKSLEDVAEAARGGAVGARVGEIVGKYAANALPTAVKGRLGETMTGVKAYAAGEGNVFVRKPLVNGGNILPGGAESGPQIKVPLSKSYTDADFVTQSHKLLEAKFGAWARLSQAQRRALRELPKGQYQVDSWLPSDIGRIGGIVGGALRSHPYDQE